MFFQILEINSDSSFTKRYSSDFFFFSISYNQWTRFAAIKINETDTPRISETKAKRRAAIPQGENVTLPNTYISLFLLPSHSRSEIDIVSDVRVNNRDNSIFYSTALYSTWIGGSFRSRGMGRGGRLISPHVEDREERGTTAVSVQREK